MNTRRRWIAAFSTAAAMTAGGGIAVAQSVHASPAAPVGAWAAAARHSTGLEAASAPVAGGRTIVLKQTDRQSSDVDVNPRGFSPGDGFITESVLTFPDSGKQAGTLGINCTF